MQNPSRKVSFLSEEVARLPLELTDLQNFENYRINFGEIFDFTPLSSWYRLRKWYVQGNILKSRRFLSDAARWALLFKFGGTYLDSDLVSLAPIPSYNNAVPFQNRYFLNNAFMSFSPRHPLLWRAMVDLRKNFNPQVKEILFGPGLLTKLVKSFKYPSRIVTLPSHFFFPIPYSQAESLLNEYRDEKIWTTALRKGSCTYYVSTFQCCS